MESIEPSKLETLIEKLCDRIADLTAAVRNGQATNGNGELEPDVVVPKVLISEALKKWLLHNQQFTPLTRQGYLLIINKFVHGLPEEVRFIEQLKTEHLQAYISKIINAGRKNRTANANLTVLKSFCHWLADNYGIENVAGKIRNLKEAPPTVRLLSEQEYEKVSTATSGNVRNIIEFFANTGVRVTECCGLTWACVDWESKRLVIIGKGRVRRAITLNSIALRILNEIRQPELDGYIFNVSFISKARQEFFVQRPDIRGKFLAKTKRGRAQQLAGLRHSRTHKEALKNTGRADKQRLERICLDAAKAAGIEKFGPHALRHWFATTLFAKGMDIGRISKLLGHSSVKTTEKIYIHFRDSFLDGSTECLVDKKGGA